MPLKGRALRSDISILEVVAKVVAFQPVAHVALAQQVGDELLGEFLGGHPNPAISGHLKPGN